jgi:hypothetical protein
MGPALGTHDSKCLSLNDGEGQAIHYRKESDFCRVHKDFSGDVRYDPKKCRCPRSGDE